MKTRNIRYAALLLAAIVSMNVSAEKNVLKAFEKFKNSKGVTITNTVREQGKTSALDPWRCNIVEFKVIPGAGYVTMTKELRDAFEQDSQDADVTYYGQMKGLSENATEEEKAKYKKTIVRYNDQDDPIVIGENTTYDVLVLRSNSKENTQNRIVVAVEWKLEGKSGSWRGNLYEIEGPNDFVRTSTASPTGEKVLVDDFVTRMTFYRDHYKYSDSAEDKALLVSMLDYLTFYAPTVSENEKAITRNILREMEQGQDGAVSPGIVMNQNLIAQCFQVLDPNAAGRVDGALVLERLDSYYKEFRRETIISMQQQILNRMAEYIRAQQEKGMSDAIFNKVVKILGDWKSACTIIAHKQYISNILLNMERKQNSAH